MSYPHAGILIDHIPAEEGGGLIFAAGTAVIFMLAFPPLLTLAGAALVGGALLVPALRWLHRREPAFVGIVSPKP